MGTLPLIWLRYFCFISDMYAVRFGLVCVPITLASLPPEVMLRMHLKRDSATDIEKTYQKGAPSESDLIEA